MLTADELRNRFIIRPGTDDLRVWQEVVEQNCYGLPDDLRGKIVLDVGAHIGTFSAACAARGAEFVLAFEPDAANHALLQQNFTQLGIPGAAIHAAIWRSDGWQGELNLSPAGEQTGGRSTAAFGMAEPVPWFPLDQVIGWLSRVDLLKMDTEGGEFPILYTTNRLAEVPWILGESHELAAEQWRIEDLIPTDDFPFTGDGLEAVLRARGYQVKRLLDFGWLRTFSARREPA